MPAGHAFGLPGSMVVVEDWLGDLPTTMRRPTAIRTNLAGGVIAQQSPGITRTHQATIPHLSPDQSGALEALFTAQLGPWWLITPWAHQHNALTPTAKPNGGPLWLPDMGVWAAGSWATNTTRIWDEFGAVPALPGVPVTASAWGVRTGTTAGGLTIQWRTATGTVISNSASAVFPLGTTPQRVHVTATPPATAAAAVIRTTAAATAAITITRPAITWTPALTTWTAPAGARVVVEEMTRTPDTAAELDGLPSETQMQVQLVEVTA